MCSGPSCCNADVRTEPHGAGGDRLDQQHCQGRVHLLPWVLQDYTWEVQAGWWGGLQTEHVQGTNN